MMKYTFAALPILALALAEQPQNQCGQSTVTETLTNRITVTVTAQTSPAAIVPVSGAEADSTEVVVSTYFITPSPTAAAVPTWSPFRNGTNRWNSTKPHHRPSGFTTYTIPAFSTVEGSSAPSSAVVAVSSSSPISSKEAVSIPASETLSIVPSSLTSVAEVATSAAPVKAAATSSAASSSTSSSSSASLSGEATFYGGNVDGGMCSFTGYTIPSGTYGTALSDSNWDTAGNCGACIDVSYGGKTIKAMVVDQCPGCGTNHLDLFQDAFTQLADASKGIIDVTWAYTSCDITSPIVLKNKSGTSAYWFSMQVQNANVRVAKLEVSTDGGNTWQATTRQDYNYFENSSGFGTTAVDVKVTSVNGDSITVNGVSVASDSTQTASGNFA